MDKYARAVEYFQSLNGTFGEEVHDAWARPSHHQHGCLFQFASKTGDASFGNSIGCLTMIAAPGGSYVAETDTLTKAIKADTRLPGHYTEIRPEHIPVLAEWQRRLDRELQRV